MVECHYRSAVGADANLNVWFHVRLWAGGRVWVRAIVENGYLGQSPGTKSYTATVNIGGTAVVNAQALSHYEFTRWTAEGWIGGNPAVTPSHNVAYLISTKLVPNYWKRSPPDSTLNGLTQTYAPMQLSPLPSTTASGGFSPHIGLLPNWDALYVTTGDARAYRASMAAASAFNTYGHARRSSATNRPALLDSFPTTTYAGGGGTEEVSTGGGLWDVSHAPNCGYLAYLVSGDYFHHETHNFSAQSFYFCTNSNRGSGVNRVIRSIQTRGVGWGFNIIGTLCGIAPTEDVAADDLAVVTQLRSWMSSNATWFADRIDLAGQNQLGTVYQFSTGAWGGDGSIGPWMTDFWVAANGLISDCEPVADQTNLVKLRNWMYRWIVGRLGPTGSANYHFASAAAYGLIIDPTATGTDFGPDPIDFYDSWGDVWTASNGSPNAETTNTLQGGSGSTPSAAVTGYWGNLMPAIAYAFDHGATGASESWSRLIGADNWSTVENSVGPSGQTFNNTPIWGIVRRGYGGT
jgi:hypothetical protein